ncbi:COP9 signalosome complex subunit 8 [Dichanthelium oligosanthes]|uniref:COP9 signalosome complex subunit 8 n=1 Tax=Dichanthelium oligosanthes TaxID=888268 RepID=A0A1E5VXX8_9POAL|nr:COP9 signalosome complex subunit 8 [Dichanthelium oligosanthes]
MDLSAVEAALSDKSYSALAPLCDDLLLQTASRGATTDEWPYAVHLLAHLYLNDLNSARFFWKSLPQEVKDARPELTAVWSIGQCLWNRDYAGVYTAAQGFEWDPNLADFITAFLGEYQIFVCYDTESYRKRIFQLLTSAYSTIIVADVAHFMGMSEEDATNCMFLNPPTFDCLRFRLCLECVSSAWEDAVQNGWSLDAATNMLTVKKPKAQTNQKLDASKLQRLTECVFHLEH